MASQKCRNAVPFFALLSALPHAQLSYECALRVLGRESWRYFVDKRVELFLIGLGF
jgi:hypothetical protein